MSQKKDSISIGNCGEYFVAAELERRGFTAAVPLSNTQDFDILTISKSSNKQYAIQVKTTSYGNLQWIVSAKVEKIKGDNIFYVFVHLHELGIPEYYIIPSEILSDSIIEKSSKKLANIGNDGTIRVDNKVRTFVITRELEMYKNAWHLLK